LLERIYDRWCMGVIMGVVEKPVVNKSIE